jgi:glycosyltransferase involved in cell wall biosynthesis
MRVAVIGGVFTMGSRPPMNPNNLWDDPRGMTGTEVTFTYLAQNMAKLGHATTLFTKVVSHDPQVQNGVTWTPSEDIANVLARDGSFDFAVSFCEPNYFKMFPHLAKKKLVLQELNDFPYTDSDAFDKVDHWVAISQNHKEQMLRVLPQVPAEKWTPIHNVVDVDLYRPDHQKIYGQCIYCSSPDRGLHELLSIWPDIRAKEPKATLRIFYDLRTWLDKVISQKSDYPLWRTLQNRAVYIDEVLPKLVANCGVSVHQAVSRNRIVEEMLSASVFTYPCAPVSYTEGFSCATLEACAAGTWPVITDADCLPSLYGSVATVIPRSKIRSDYADAVVSAIRSDGDRNKLREFAKGFDLKYQADAFSKLFSELVT